MTKLSPVKIHGLMMGMWFLASAYGQYIAGLLGAGLATPGEYAITVEAPDPAAALGSRTIAWKDTSGTSMVFDKMEIVISSAEADSSKIDWKVVPSTSFTAAKITEAGDTVAWKVTEIPNDGSETLALPSKLMGREDMDISMAPRSIERLKCYTDGYGKLGLYALVAGVLLIAISPMVRKLMGDVH